jgi:hypothetical protein
MLAAAVLTAAGVGYSGAWESTTLPAPAQRFIACYQATAGSAERMSFVERVMCSVLAAQGNAADSGPDVRRLVHRKQLKLRPSS